MATKPVPTPEKCKSKKKAKPPASEYKPKFKYADLDQDIVREHEKRAGVTYQALMDDIIQARSRLKDSTGANTPWSLGCNNPTLKAQGELKELEEHRAWRMLQILSLYRGPDEVEGVPIYSLAATYRKVQIDANTVSYWREVYPLFSKLMQNVQDEMVEAMRAEVFRRAVVGHAEPLVYQGEPTGHHVRKYSDTLLQFSLMGHDLR